MIDRRIYCDGLAFHPEGSRNTPSRFMLGKPGQAPALMGHLARIQSLPLSFTIGIELWYVHLAWKV